MNSEVKFGDFSQEDVGEKPPEPVVVKKFVPHMKSHGLIWYHAGHGHVCPVWECEVNRDPKSMDPIFDAMDRKEYEGGKPIDGEKS